MNDELQKDIFMRKLFWDQHIHTSFSGDCEEDPAAQAAAAKEKGLIGITITDHKDEDAPGADGYLFDLDTKDYLRKIKPIASALSDSDLTVLTGLELGLTPHLAGVNKKIVSEGFDFIIGSIHYANGKDPYYPEYFKGRNVHESYLEYFQCTLDNLHAFSDFDALGHLDYVKRYCIKTYGAENGCLNYTDFSGLFDEIFIFLIEHDLALEINSGVYRAGLTEPNPGIDLIKRYKSLGGKMITLGSDAHENRHVGLEFNRVSSILTDIGFNSYLVYKDRRPYEYPLIPCR